jgi:hypothetical protein
MQKVMIFLAGAVFGIAALFVGGWLWFSIVLGWLPYRTPDPRIISQLEILATQQLPNRWEWDRFKPRPPGDYSRWYVQGTENGRAVIWGEWDIPDSAKYRRGVILGHRRFPPGYRGMLGGGCGQVHLTYDLQNTHLSLWCNAPL